MIAIKDIRHEREDFAYRTPIKFGGVALDKATLLNVTLDIEAGGKAATGFGSMPMGNVWAFPSKSLAYSDTLAAMLDAAERMRKLYLGAAGPHPIDITHEREKAFPAIAADVTSSLGLVDPMPLLAVMVVASAFDAALHDAFGKLHGRNCYKTYGPDFLPHDLGHYLGHDFAGSHLQDALTTQPQERMPLYHLVGALDPLTAGDVSKPVGDGLPETLEEWIPYNGLTHLKIKLNGEDLKWDVERVLGVDRVAESKRAVGAWFYSLDFNEKCANVAYLVDFLKQVGERAPIALERVQYIEQPTKRDLKADRANAMHAASRIKPVVIDEALIDLESLLTARDMGYTGAALKACKGQTQSLLLAAAARQMGMFLCVQDLTCPGASLIHSAGLAAHVKGVAAIEANARQYFPAANKPWESKFPGLFVVRDGWLRTGELVGEGLGITNGWHR